MTKIGLRKVYMSKRKSLSDKEFREFSELLTGNLLAIVGTIRLEIVHTYISIKKNREYDPFPFVESLDSIPDLKIAVPRIDKGKKELEHVLIDSDTEFRETEMGIGQPVNGELVAESDIDLVVTPLLCFDKRGHRVGYGGGYYDKFLAKCRPDCLKIGVSFFDPIEKIEDIHERDVRLDYCVTPNRIYDFH